MTVSAGSRHSRLALFLMGPTASGKTSLAMALADVLPIDIISVDSAMVYRGMDLGTAKPDQATLGRYPHQLIDIRDPSEAYSAAAFVADAESAVEASFARGRIPVLVGGTMLYFKSLKSGLAEMPSADRLVRGHLEARASREGLAALHAELRSVDPVAAGVIHPNNRQRLLRALEVFTVTGRPISGFWRQDTVAMDVRLDCRVLQVSLEPSREKLHENIETRLEVMLAAGFAEEVDALMQRGDLHRDLPSMRAVGYRQMWDYLAGNGDRKTMVDAVLAATRGLAKRQMTWLRAFEAVHRIDPAATDPCEVTLKLVDAAPIVHSGL